SFLVVSLLHLNCKFVVEKNHHLRKKMMARCQVLDFAATYTTCGYPARISTRAETHQQAAAR
ncbi:hypothetical protein, partial [Lacticaseibacillus paracasei]|uniref:hypothetical protein n=1 Tax=Lacticaseibacillus paracasei TaxID=1597 RepID=UPI002441FDB7